MSHLILLPKRHTGPAECQCHLLTYPRFFCFFRRTGWWDGGCQNFRWDHAILLWVSDTCRYISKSKTSLSIILYQKFEVAFCSSRFNFVASILAHSNDQHVWQSDRLLWNNASLPTCGITFLNSFLFISSTEISRFIAHFSKMWLKDLTHCSIIIMLSKQNVFLMH